jgi:hypothetical protein
LFQLPLKRSISIIVQNLALATGPDREAALKFIVVVISVGT